MAIQLKQMVEAFGITPVATGGKKAKTPVFRATYAFVHEPKETPSGDMKYMCCMIFNKDDKAELKEVVQSIANAAASKFGEDPAKWPKNLKNPLRDGDEERDNPEYENTYFMNGGNKNKPGIVNAQLQPIMDVNEFYSGCYARASLSFYGYDVKGNKGVGTGLNNLMFVKDGERLDGQTSAEDDFAEYKQEAAVDGNESGF